MKTKTKIPSSKLRVGIVVPHIFMHADILPHVIFSPGKLALELCSGLQGLGIEVTLYSPGPIDTSVKNVTADLTLFEQELEGRGDSYLELLKKHPFTFITLARQVQSEVIAAAMMAANDNELDIVHIYTNEEDIALPMAKLCTKPVIFTHHDPFNFLVKYKNVFPKYSRLPWLSMSYSQRAGMPKNTNWIANIYHGLPIGELSYIPNPNMDYFLYIGRIIEPKGVHLAIQALREFNKSHNKRYKLKIAGKHYAGHKKDTYWQQIIEPTLSAGDIEYVGFINSKTAKSELIGNAKAIIVPSIFDEPFGLVMIEALACGTPAIGLDSGAIPEVIEDGKTGYVVQKAYGTELDKLGLPILDEQATASTIAAKMGQIDSIKREYCRQRYQDNFTTDRMCYEHKKAYELLIQSPDRWQFSGETGSSLK